MYIRLLTLFCYCYSYCYYYHYYCYHCQLPNARLFRMLNLELATDRIMLYCSAVRVLLAILAVHFRFGKTRLHDGC